jgi:hypothetical protein
MQKTLHANRAGDFVDSLSSLGLVALALVGMGGIVYHVLSPGGLISHWLGRLWATHPVLGLLAIVGLITMGLTARANPASSRKAHGNSDLPLYVFVGFGTFFAVSWLW